MKNYTLFTLLFLTQLLVYPQATPQQMVERMGRGINLGNCLSAPHEGDWAPAVEETYFDDIASVGFTAVRIPMRFDLHTTALSSVNYTDSNGNYSGSMDDYSVDPVYLTRIEQITDWALSKGLVAVIDVHGDKWYWESYDSGSSEYKTGNDRLAAEDRFRAIWRDISVKFQNKSENLLFEIMNEAYFSMSAPEVDAVNTNILSIIRQTNPTRNVIVNGGGENSWEAPLQMSTTFLNSDSHLIATFHYYKPGEFTRSSGQNQNDFDWGNAADKASVDADFDAVLNWSQTNNIPVYLGEFGADNEGGYNYYTENYGDYGGPENASRVEYHHYLAEAAISRGFCFTAWDAGDRANKTIYKVTDRSWVTDVRDAILGTTGCSTSGIISNADIECGFNSDWDLFVQSPAVATNSNAPLAEVRNGKTMQVDVSTDGAAFNKVLLRNLEVDATSLAGKTLNFTCYAKASSNTQQFKIRLKAVVNGVSQLTASPSLDLSNSAGYQLYEFQYQVPQNVSTLQFQVLCGKYSGTYYFDDFSAVENDGTLSITILNSQSLKLFPNPTHNTIYFKTLNTIVAIEIFDVSGKKIMTTNTIVNNQLNVSQLDAGMYMLRILDTDKQTVIKKLIID